MHKDILEIPQRKITDYKVGQLVLSNAKAYLEWGNGTQV